jgi:hypothetical protein
MPTWNFFIQGTSVGSECYENDGIIHRGTYLVIPEIVRNLVFCFVAEAARFTLPVGTAGLHNVMPGYALRSIVRGIGPC